VSQVATTIIELEDKELKMYEGDYRYYMTKNAEVRAKVEQRYLAGSGGVQKARDIVAPDEGESDGVKKKKSFGGKAAGVKGASKRGEAKGVKNAKRTGTK